MPTPTYTPLATVTLGASASSVTFSSIPATFRDLIVVLSVKSSGGNNLARARYNSDSGSNYSRVFMRGDGSSATSAAETDTGAFIADVDSTNFFVQTTSIMDYSATDKHKTSLSSTTRGDRVQAFANRWANTAAITSVQVVISSNTFDAGSTFSLYGVIA